MQPERDNRSEPFETIKRRVQQVYNSKPTLWPGAAGTVAGFWTGCSLAFLNHYFSLYILPEKSLVLLVFGCTVSCGILSVVAGKQVWAALGQAALALLTGSIPQQKKQKSEL